MILAAIVLGSLILLSATILYLVESNGEDGGSWCPRKCNYGKLHHQECECFTIFTLPVIRAAFPKLVTEDIISVQPMTSRVTPKEFQVMDPYWAAERSPGTCVPRRFSCGHLERPMDFGFGGRFGCCVNYRKPCPDCRGWRR